MAVAKKATKKTAAKKKAATKKVVQTVGGKNNKRPVAEFAAPDLDLARRVLAHAFVKEANLRIGDEFHVSYMGDFEAAHLIGSQYESWSSKQDEYVTFLGIDQHGSLICHDEDDDEFLWSLPICAVNTDSINEGAAGNKIKLNHDYTADLSNVKSDNEVIVGCQSVPVAKIEALYQRIQEIKNNQPAKRSLGLTMISSGIYAELVWPAK